jgi:hypothetical protein
VAKVAQVSLFISGSTYGFVRFGITDGAVNLLMESPFYTLLLGSDFSPWKGVFIVAPPGLKMTRKI